MRHACKWAELLKSSRHVRAHDANYIMTRNIYIYICVYIYIIIYTHKWQPLKIHCPKVYSGISAVQECLEVSGNWINHDIHMKNSVGVKIVKTIEP